MKTAISVPDETFASVEKHAAKLGVSRSEFFARAAERWVEELEGEDITAAIDAALEGVDQEAEFGFIAQAAQEVARRTEWRP